MTPLGETYAMQANMPIMQPNEGQMGMNNVLPAYQLQANMNEQNYQTAIQQSNAMLGAAAGLLPMLFMF